MRVIVDLVTCQGFAQCVFAAPEVFRLRGAESLEFDYEPEDGLREKVEQAVISCPVRAIRIGQGEDIDWAEGTR